jgi:hypothetical protein
MTGEPLYSDLRGKMDISSSQSHMSELPHGRNWMEHGRNGMEDTKV